MSQKLEKFEVDIFQWVSVFYVTVIRANEK